MTEQKLHDYNKWLMEVWNPNQLHIPFVEDAPRAYLKYKNEHREYNREVPDYADPQNIWFDEGRLKLQKKKKKVKAESVAGDDNGCDVPAPMGKRG